MVAAVNLQASIPKWTNNQEPCDEVKPSVKKLENILKLKIASIESEENFDRKNLCL